MTGWLVTGAAGMLGREIIAALQGEGENVTGLAHDRLDVTDEDAVYSAVRNIRPVIVVNCAAWTAVDDAEAHEDSALLANGHAVGYIAGACADSGARLLHMSTDYVFSGDAGHPYSEHDAPAPRTAYGRTKLAGERAVAERLPRAGYVIRTAWLYGAHGPNFVRSVIRMERETSLLRVVDDQRGQPTWTADVACQVIALGRSHAPAGLYHATSSGETTWYGLAQEIFRLLGADPDRVRPVTSGEYPRAAPRPAYSVLGHDSWAIAGISPIGDWRVSLAQALPVLALPR